MCRHILFYSTQLVRLHRPDFNKYRADSWRAPSQWETSLQSNAVSHWLGANLESAQKWYMSPRRPLLLSWHLTQIIASHLKVGHPKISFMVTRSSMSSRHLATQQGIRMIATIMAARGPLYQHGSTLIPAWISNRMSIKVWDGITYPFLNFNGCTVEVSEWISNFIPHFIMDVITYLCWD